MRRTIITHVGTTVIERDALSAAPNVLPPADVRAWTEEIKLNQTPSPTRRTKLCNALVAGLKAVWNDPRRADDTTRRQAVSAELASLQLLRLQPCDRVALVCSDTVTGKVCGDLLREALLRSAEFGWLSGGLDVPLVYPLAGVEIEDGGRFVSEGLAAYAGFVARERKERTTEDQIIFNITGGYKGMIPFATLAALLLRANPDKVIATSVVYLHESARQLIALDTSLPLDWLRLKEQYRQIRSERERNRQGSEIHEPYVEMVYALISQLGWE